jgi:serine/threonine-protein kinase
MSEEAPRLSILAGRYVLGEPIGRGGAATVHLGKPTAGPGRRGVVAIKKLHPHLAADPAFVAMMLDEARLLSRVRHPNVVSTLDVVMEDGQLYIVMEYVHGLTLGTLLQRAHARKARPPAGVACAIARDTLLGLHAAHEATGPSGEPLGMVHRDVSPQNLLLAEDGKLKVVDFGIAKAEGRVQHTEDGSIKGKLGYMPPEQLFGDTIDRRSDVYAAGVVLWEALVGARLFAGDNDAPALVKSLVAHVEPPSSRVPEVSEALDRVVLRALAHDKAHRYQTAQEMADALAAAHAPAPAAEVGAWVRSLAGDVLDERGAKLFVFDGASREVIADLARQRESVAVLPASALARPRRTWAFVIGAALCAAGGGAAAALLGSRGLGPAADPGAAASASEALSAGLGKAANEPAASAATGDSAAALASAAPSQSAPPQSAPPPASAEPGESEPAAASASARSSADAAKSGQAPGPRKAAPKPAPRPDGCDPPFTIDAQGHKRYKRECLR